MKEKDTRWIQRLRQLFLPTMQWMGGIEKRPSLLVFYPIFVYVVFLTIYYTFFDAGFFLGMENAESLWQFLPLNALKERPLSSLFYLHSRPPLANALFALGLFLGINEQIFAFWNHIAGLLLFYASFRFIHCLSSGRRFSYILFLVFIFFMSLNLLAFINYILYTFSAAALITGIAWFGFAYLREGKRFDLICFVIITGILSLFRTPYGLFFLLPLAVLFITRGGSAAIIGTAIAMVPALLWSLKNYIIFGFFGTASLLGITLFINAGPNVYKEKFYPPGIETEKLKDQILEEMPRYAPLFVGFIRKPSLYEKSGYLFSRNPKFERIPALKRNEKDGWWGASNKNAYEYLQLSRDYLDLNKMLIKAMPLNYLNNCLLGFYLFLKPSWMYAQTVTGVHNTHPHLFKIYNLPALNHTMIRERSLFISRGHDLFPVAFFLVCGLLLYSFFKPTFTDRHSTILLVLIIFTGTAGSVLISNMESMRYKFEIEPLVMSLFWGLIGALLSRIFYEKEKLKYPNPG